jgi:hypothetical protein
MKDGVCTKCGKREVRRSPEALRGVGNQLSISNFKGARLAVYCCTACGWVESWVEDEADRARIAEKWERAR